MIPHGFTESYTAIIIQMVSIIPWNELLFIDVRDKACFVPVPEAYWILNFSWIF